MSNTEEIADSLKALLVIGDRLVAQLIGLQATLEDLATAAHDMVEGQRHLNLIIKNRL